MLRWQRDEPKVGHTCTMGSTFAEQRFFTDCTGIFMERTVSIVQCSRHRKEGPLAVYVPICLGSCDWLTWVLVCALQ